MVWSNENVSKNNVLLQYVPADSLCIHQIQHILWNDKLAFLADYLEELHFASGANEAKSKAKRLSITTFITGSKGVYPQSNRSLATVDIDASKWFVDLWVHLSFAIFAIFDAKRQLK